MKTGDLVQLKSGGPIMTVGQSVSLDKGQAFICYWFSHEDEKLCSSCLPEDCISVVEKV